MTGTLRRMWCQQAQRGERYTLTDVARILGVSRPTVYKWIDRGILSAARPMPGVVAIKRRAIRRAMLHPEVAELVAANALGVRKRARSAG